MSIRSNCLNVVALLAVSLVTCVGWAAEVGTDQDISKWVQDALRHDLRTIATEITVSTTKGIVTLSGKVPNVASQKYADQEAKKIAGVVGVINEIEVAPQHRLDLDINLDVRHRILNNATIHTQAIRVECVDGVVTLSGKVDTYAEELEAELLASEVTGVRKVHNNLLTTYETARSDEEIKSDVEAAVKRDVYLSGLPISVAVKVGVVTLTGSVATAYEKDRAAEEVYRLTNVQTVENNLQIDPALHQHERQPMIWPNEEELQKAIKTELSEDGRINASHISIEVEYGHATLKGTVTTQRESRLAEQDVRDVVGVGWVTNNLEVKADTRDDVAIDVGVDFELGVDQLLQVLDIKPAVKAGIVTLTGTVHTLYEKTHAAEVVARVKGVRGVVNKLVMDGDTNQSNTVLEKMVRDRLLQNAITSPAVFRLQVKVNNGIAMLIGRVDTWAQRAEAERVTLGTEGIWRIDNRLQVNGYDYPWDQWQYQGDFHFDPLYTPQHYFDYGP